MSGNKGANKGRHYSHSEKFWRSRYEKVKLALADDEFAFNRFNSDVRDLDLFRGYWKLNGGRWENIVKAFRDLVSEEATESE